jgi:hypothetical protein
MRGGGGGNGLGKLGQKKFAVGLEISSPGGALLLGP